MTYLATTPSHKEVGSGKPQESTRAANTRTFPERNREIFELRAMGASLQAIASRFELTYARVWAILCAGNCEGRTLGRLPWAGAISPVTRALLLRLGYTTPKSVHDALDSGALYCGCTFGMGAKRFAEIQKWAFETQRTGREDEHKEELRA